MSGAGAPNPEQAPSVERAIGARRSLGVFDSGVGGLTVVARLREVLPDVDLVYLGDTARLPYGTKSPSTVARYTRRNVAFLLAQRVDGVVVACNSASAMALDTLEAAVPVWGVIEPGARAAALASGGRIGVLATASTVASGAYPRAVAAVRPELVVEQQACPLFVPLVEEGWLDGPVCEAIARRYLEPLLAAEVDTLVLGCTHYPLLAPLLARLAGPDVTLIDSAAAVSAQVAAELATGEDGGRRGGGGSLRLLVTDRGPGFEALARRIVGDDLELEWVDVPVTVEDTAPAPAAAARKIGRMSKSSAPSSQRQSSGRQSSGRQSSGGQSSGSQSSGNPSSGRSSDAGDAPAASRRSGGRGPDRLRPVRLVTGVSKHAEGSVQIECGDTRVLAMASVERRVPPFRYDSGMGWVTAEYSMLPRATHTRAPREVTRGRPGGRTAEIQRLIGRSLRSVVDMRAMPDLTVTVDCDVLQADGGTRTASITAGYVALALALGRLYVAGDLERWPLIEPLAAVSVGLVDDVAMLDLDYSEDSEAQVDLNVVATGSGRLVELQGTGEQRTFSREELDRLLDLAFAGVAELVRHQDEALAPLLADVRSAEERRARPPAEPRQESELWGPPKTGS